MLDTAPCAVPEGRHVLAELTGCPAAVLDDAAGLEASLRRCVEEGGATLVSSHFHRFAPQGVSGVVVIAESHLTIHTWPEHGYAAVDVFTCGRPEVADAIMDLAILILRAEVVKRSTFNRGPYRVPSPLPAAGI